MIVEMTYLNLVVWFLRVSIPLECLLNHFVWFCHISWLLTQCKFSMTVYLSWNDIDEMRWRILFHLLIFYIQTSPSVLITQINYIKGFFDKLLVILWSILNDASIFKILRLKRLIFSSWHFKYFDIYFFCIVFFFLSSVGIESSMDICYCVASTG